MLIIKKFIFVFIFMIVFCPVISYAQGDKSSFDKPKKSVEEQILEKEILIIENLTNLDKLLNREFEFNCIPLKIENADGSPVRAFARLKDE